MLADDPWRCLTENDSWAESPMGVKMSYQLA